GFGAGVDGLALPLFGGEAVCLAVRVGGDGRGVLAGYYVLIGHGSALASRDRAFAAYISDSLIIECVLGSGVVKNIDCAHGVVSFRATAIGRGHGRLRCGRGWIAPRWRGRHS